jgi:hypothetical protein|tara:strand:- start:6276 stop:6764 length:489 start_codon:yes stop_codon:yes gene_type:complete
MLKTLLSLVGILYDCFFWLFICLLFMFFVVLASAYVCTAETPPDRLIKAIEEVESGGNTSAVGDRHLSDKAYGCLQIRQPCVDDYNRWHKTNYRAEQMLGNYELSIAICREYIDYYAIERRIGREPTLQDMARIWNGGPNGYKKPSTKKYWEKVKEVLKTEE